MSMAKKRDGGEDRVSLCLICADEYTDSEDDLCDDCFRAFGKK